MITCVWAFALAFHALSHSVDGRQLEDRKRQEYVEEQRS